MADETLPDNERTWDEGDTPQLQVTLVDSTGTPIPLSAISTLTLTQWVETGPPGRPGTIATRINSRNAQNVKNANNVTVGSTTGLVTWQLGTGDTAMQSNDLTVTEEKHYFRFDLNFVAAAVTLAKSYPDFYTVVRKRAVK